MERDELIEKIRGRVLKCRRLAGSVTDERTARALNEMADEGEADIRRLLNDGPSPILQIIAGSDPSR